MWLTSVSPIASTSSVAVPVHSCRDLTKLALAKEHMQVAKNDVEYANGQYEMDMSRDRLYADTDKAMN